MKKLINLIQGYVELHVTGAFPERLLNLCAQNRVQFWRLEWLDETSFTFRIALRDRRRLEELAREVERLFPQGAAGEGEALLTNAWQAEAAQRALESVRRAGEALGVGVTPDALLTDVEEALGALGELTGRSVREDVTARIFERFCVGK